MILDAVTGTRAETLPARFFTNAGRLGTQVAHTFQTQGAWFPVGWATMADLIRALAAGLIALGHEPTEPVAVLSRSRREALYWDLAALAAGGVSVCLYPSLDPDACRHMLRYVGVRYCVVEDEAQLATVRPCLEPAGPLRRIVVLDASPAAQGDDPRVASHDHLRRLGVASTIDVAARSEALATHDAAVFLYTSGTTGAPKPAMISHGNLVAALRAVEATKLLGEDDRNLSLLPLAWPLQRLLDYACLWAGVPTAYPASQPIDWAELARIQPTVMAALPHLLEDCHQVVHEPATQSPALQEFLVWARDVSRQEAHDREHGSVAPALRAQIGLARRLLSHRMRRHLGGRMRLIVSAGGPVSADVNALFEAAGVPIVEGWGMAETFALGTLNLPAARRAGSIGRPMPGVELALDDDGELLARGPHVFSGYYRGGAATTAAFTIDGYFRTGDLARVDEEGFYYAEGRKEDLIVTRHGDRIRPREFERSLEADPRIAHALVVGHARPYLVALISLERARQAAIDETALERVIAGVIASRNIDLDRATQVRDFRILPHALSEESGELTPTRTVRRAVVTRKFQYLIDEMYE